MSYINTYTGQHFYYDDPRNFDIRDIARALSNICRFTGHLKEFYSVAQHSVMASHLVPRPFALEALLHDAHEAYVGDCNAPLKSMLPDYRHMESRIEQALRAHFKVPVRMSSCVKEADMIMLATERRDLLVGDETPWPCLEGIEPMRSVIAPMDPRDAYAFFITRYHQLTLGK